MRQLGPGPCDAANLTSLAASPDESWLGATMPAQVHDVLLAHRRIPDPHVGRNAAESAWVGEEDWAYACRFPTPEGIGGGPVFLRFGGLDTVADVYLNGRLVAEPSGYTTGYVMIPLDEEARAALKPGRNVIAVRCRQTGGGQYIDAGLIDVEETPIP